MKEGTEIFKDGLVTGEIMFLSLGPCCHGRIDYAVPSVYYCDLVRPATMIAFAKENKPIQLPKHKGKFLAKKTKQ
jgi:hypothetical protein